MDSEMFYLHEKNKSWNVQRSLKFFVKTFYQKMFSKKAINKKIYSIHAKQIAFKTKERPDWDCGSFSEINKNKYFFLFN